MNSMTLGISLVQCNGSFFSVNMQKIFLKQQQIATFLNSLHNAAVQLRVLHNWNELFPALIGQTKNFTNFK